MFWTGVIVGLLQGVLAYSLERLQKERDAAQSPSQPAPPPGYTGNETAP